MSSIYDKLGNERKKLQQEGLMPDWYSTGGWQLFKERYMYQADSPKEQYERIARTLSMHTPDPDKWFTKFFDILWKGWLSPSTPVLANTGTSRGLPVSCAGTYISDSISDIYTAKHEVAMLTKYGFGTASYLGDIRPRGMKISVGGEAEGVLPVIQGIQKDMEYVSQGNARRGSWAGYLPITHGDFDEVCTYLEQNPDGNNIGWNVSNEFIEALNNRQPEALSRYAKTLKTKMVTGKGYNWFIDKANDRAPQWYKDKGMKIKSSQLCSEISLYSDEDHTFTCVLSSMIAMKWDEWKDTDAVEVATVFLDCVVQEFIERDKNI
jgi:ribonucleoside-diphosphate reductase alpha chain